ncbi:MAG: hypothetical protein IPG18_05700 [Saprospiraceae bacterium]|nr:hypothetical protein [Saprospiraceae bacterium]MBK6784800.1 hypothetical protein [Saprospiraceae bacterium]
MPQIDIIRNRIIDKLLAISDEKYLLALARLVEKTSSEEATIKLTKEQKMMLEMSEEDIKHGRVVPQSVLDKADLEWLKEK